MSRAGHQVLAEFHEKRPGHTAKSLQKDMKISMRTAVHSKAKRAVMRDGNRALIRAEFECLVVTEANECEDAVNNSQPPTAAFIKKCVNIVCAVLSTMVQSRNLKALVRRHEHSESDRLACMRSMSWKLSSTAVLACRLA